MTLNDSQRAFRVWLMAGLKAKWPLRICGVNHTGFVAKMATKDLGKQSPKTGRRPIGCGYWWPGPRGRGVLRAIPPPPLPFNPSHGCTERSGPTTHEGQPPGVHGAPPQEEGLADLACHLASHCPQQMQTLHHVSVGQRGVKGLQNGGGQRLGLTRAERCERDRHKILGPQG